MLHTCNNASRTLMHPVNCLVNASNAPCFTSLVGGLRCTVVSLHLFTASRGSLCNMSTCCRHIHKPYTYTPTCAIKESTLSCIKLLIDRFVCCLPCQAAWHVSAYCMHMHMYANVQSMRTYTVCMLVYYTQTKQKRTHAQTRKMKIHVKNQSMQKNS